MGKDSYWFPHDAGQSQDPRIVALIQVYNLEGYGRYWLLIEFLRMQEDYRYDVTKRFSMTSLSQLLRTESLEACIRFIEDCVKEFDLLSKDEVYIWSQDLMNKMAPWDETKRKMSERGKKGADVTNAKRSAQAKGDDGTSAAQVENFPAIRGDKEYKEEERVEIDEINNTHTNFSEVEKADYISFKNHVSAYAYSVEKLQNPFTIEEYLQIRKKYPQRVITHILAAMHNSPKLSEQNKSAFQAFKKFIRCEKSDGIKSMIREFQEVMAKKMRVA